MKQYRYRFVVSSMNDIIEAESFDEADEKAYELTLDIKDDCYYELEEMEDEE